MYDIRDNPNNKANSQSFRQNIYKDNDWAYFHQTVNVTSDLQKEMNIVFLEEKTVRKVIIEI